MSQQPYTPPELGKSAFHCPHCDAYSNQLWGTAHAQRNTGGLVAIKEIDIGWCTHCGKNTIWFDGKLVYPDATHAPPPNADLPPEIISDYQEAASIIGKSPRGAAALLRLCIQKLCKHLGEGGKNINNDIASLEPISKLPE